MLTTILSHEMGRERDVKLQTSAARYSTVLKNTCAFKAFCFCLLVIFFLWYFNEVVKPNFSVQMKQLPAHTITIFCQKDYSLALKY